MASPISEDGAVDEARHAGYDVMLFVDAVEQSKYRLGRTHLKIEGDRITMSGSAVLKLHKNDVVQLRLKPKGLRPKSYRIPAQGAVMSVQLLRWY